MNEPSNKSDLANKTESAFKSALLNLASIFAVAAAMIYCNGGIGVGGSNHVGLLPVVRRILDPNYLPGDFNIALRFYHHRAFAYLVAGGSALFGEDRALITLAVLGMILMSAALFGLCRALGLSRGGFVVVGALVATRFGWTGRGLELNEFLGDPEVMPPLFAHALALLTLTALVKDRYRLAAFFTGLAILLHLQIGVTLALMTLPLYLIWLRDLVLEPGAVATGFQASEPEAITTGFSREKSHARKPGGYRSRFRNGLKEVFVLAALASLPALPALWHVGSMLGRGLAKSSVSSAFYIDFRHPHHFELLSTAAGMWVVAHVLIIGWAWLFFRRREVKLEQAIGKLLICCAALAVLSLIHFADYYLIKNDKLAQVQFIRLSPLVTVLGALCFVLVVNDRYRTGSISDLRIAQRFASDNTGRSRSPFRSSVNLALVAAAAVWGWYSPRRIETPYSFGVQRLAEEKTTWADVARWVKASGPRDTVYLAPPGRNGFSVISQRSIVAEFKLNPDGSMYLAEWFERLRDLAGGQLPNGRGFENRKLLDKAFAKLGHDQLSALGAKYNAACAVLPKDSKAAFDVLYQNKDYRVVRLR